MSEDPFITLLNSSQAAIDDEDDYEPCCDHPELSQAAVDDEYDFGPCCDHPELDEKTGSPYYHGCCDVYLVCDNCGHEQGIVGSDGVL